MKQVNISREIFNDSFFPFLESKARVEVFYGGGGSGKSHFLAQREILRVLKNKEENILIVRKVSAANHNTTFSDHCSIINSWGVQSFFKINSSVGGERITCINGNEIIYGGCKDLKELEKLKGIRATKGPITKIRMEEASEFSQIDFFQLNNVRLRGETTQFKQMTLTLNPVAYGEWIKKYFFDNAKPNTYSCEHKNVNKNRLAACDILVHKSTHIDNQFYGEEERKELLKLEFTDEYYFKVYVLGEWGSLSGLVFNNFVVEDFSYGQNDLENVSNGLDFGFIHAQAFIRCGFKDGELYIFDEVYSNEVTNSEHLAMVYEKYGDESLGWAIGADNASPDKIKEWEDFGYRRIDGAKKGPESLKHGIEFLIGHKVHIHATNCPRLAKEFQMFKRRQDKNGAVTEKFVEINDDGIAATRYATEWLWHGQKTIINESFGLDYIGL